MRLGLLAPFLLAPLHWRHIAASAACDLLRGAVANWSAMLFNLGDGGGRAGAAGALALPAGWCSIVRPVSSSKSASMS